MAKHDRQSHEGSQEQGNGKAPYQLEAGRTNRVESHLGTVVVVGPSGRQTFDKDHGLMNDQYKTKNNPRGWRYFNMRPVPFPVCAETLDEAKSFGLDISAVTTPVSKQDVLDEVSRWMDQLEAFDAADEVMAENGKRAVPKRFKIVTDNSGTACSVSSFVIQKLYDSVKLHVQKLAQSAMRKKAEEELRAEYEITKPTSTRATRTVKAGETFDPADSMEE